MKILIVGFGSIARKHLEALKLLNIELEIHALRSNASADKEIGVKNIYLKTEMDENYNFAIISNPTNLHFEAIDFLINKAIPLFIEKPPLASLIGAEELNRKLIKADIKTYVACNLRFHPCILYLKKMIATGGSKINEVNVYCGSYLPDWRKSSDYKRDYSANKNQGGGVHLDLFHELDYTHWIFGNPLFVNSYKTSHSSLQIDAVDYANYLLGYADFSVNIILNYYRKIPKRTIEIVFDDRTITVDLIKNQITEEEKVLFFDDTFTINDTYTLQMNFFIQKVLSNNIQMNTFNDSLLVLKTCLHD